jgi:phenylacetate-CoA ligase
LTTKKAADRIGRLSAETKTAMFWNKEIETLARPELERLQLRRLRQTLERAVRSPFYPGRGEDPPRIESLEDVASLPFTTKDDLRSDENYPYGFLTVDREQLVRLHSSSGTTGRPTTILHTRGDLDSWTELVARCLTMAGVTASDVFQNMMGYGLFTGGLGLHYGAERVGALTIPAGAGNSRKQISLMRDFSTTAIHIIPSYALRLPSTFENMGYDPRDLPVRTAILGAEPHSDTIRRRIEALWGLKAFNSYGLSEMNGPGVAFECECQEGLHLWEDSYLAEIIDPDTLAPLPEGERGELVLTTLTREGMPLVRYRTQDLTSARRDHCPCGRTHLRIDRITGRTDDMLIIKGVNIYPIQVERVLMRFSEIGSNYLIVLTREERVDQMTVMAELEKGFFRGDLASLEGLRSRIANELRGEILITPRVELVEAGSLPVAEGKAIRVEDRRNG